jgi:hypothetical protein
MISFSSLKLNDSQCTNALLKTVQRYMIAETLKLYPIELYNVTLHNQMRLHSLVAAKSIAAA